MAEATRRTSTTAVRLTAAALAAMVVARETDCTDHCGSSNAASHVGADICNRLSWDMDRRHLCSSGKSRAGFGYQSAGTHRCDARDERSCLRRPQHRRAIHALSLQLFAPAGNHHADLDRCQNARRECRKAGIRARESRSGEATGETGFRLIRLGVDTTEAEADGKQGLRDPRVCHLEPGRRTKK